MIQETLHPPRPILLIDDEANALMSYEVALRSAGFTNLVTCTDSRQAMALVEENQPTLVITDLTMPKVSGQQILAKIMEDYPEINCIVVSGVNDMETALECFRAGAFDYLLKPAKKDRLVSLVRKAVEIDRLRRENRRLKSSVLADSLEHPEAFAEILGTTRSMRSVFQYCEAIAESPHPVLITGETGAGKELVARALGRLSRTEKPFVAVNVAGLDDTMFSDTLFGHARGAFSGADNTRGGLVAKAANGILFLDEIGDLPPQSQVKLLRLIDQREYYPLGSDLAKPSRARIVAATHVDLAALQHAGSFRRDLYYRLRTHQVALPPLRERLEDLPSLLDHFLEASAQELGKPTPSYHPALLDRLGSYHFPGNVRELKGMVLEALANHDGGMLSAKSFNAHISDIRGEEIVAEESMEMTEAPWIARLKRLPTLREAQELLVSEALRRANGNRRAASEMLGISHQALSKRLRRSTES